MKKIPKKQRILRQKPRHVIDASVLFGSMDQKNPEIKDICGKYLGAMGHKYKGFVTIPLLGETFLAVDRDKRDNFRFAAHSYLHSLLENYGLNVIRIRKDRDRYVETLLKIDNLLEEDDATHLSAAITDNHSIFVTVEDNLAGEGTLVNRARIRYETGLEIKHPKEIIENLAI